jgi:tetratricopeptide (TPR) repeat protein
VRFERGRILAARVPAPAERVLDAVLPLCGKTTGSYAFYAENLFGDQEGVLEGVVDPYVMLAASLAEHARDDMVEAVLRKYEDDRVRLVVGRDLNRLALGPEAKPLIDLLRASPWAPDELIQQCGLPKQTAARILYALFVTHMVAPHEARDAKAFESQTDLKVSDPAPPPASSAAAPRPPGVAAWQSLASLRPGGRPPSGVRPSVNPPQSSSRPPSEPLSLAPEPTDRAGHKRRVEELLEKGRVPEALAAVEVLARDPPNSTDVLGLQARVLFEKYRGDPDGLPKFVVDLLRKALENEPDDVHALFTRGLVYQRGGDAKKSLAYFRRVLQLDPKHIEAQREVRLAKLRGG